MEIILKIIKNVTTGVFKVSVVLSLILLISVGIYGWITVPDLSGYRAALAGITSSIALAGSCVLLYCIGSSGSTKNKSPEYQIADYSKEVVPSDRGEYSGEYRLVNNIEFGLKGVYFRGFNKKYHDLIDITTKEHAMIFTDIQEAEKYLHILKYTFRYDHFEIETMQNSKESQ